MSVNTTVSAIRTRESSESAASVDNEVKYSGRCANTNVGGEISEGMQIAVELPPAIGQCSAPHSVPHEPALLKSRRVGRDETQGRYKCSEHFGSRIVLMWPSDSPCFLGDERRRDHGALSREPKINSLVAVPELAAVRYPFARYVQRTNYLNMCTLSTY